jgi:hypothetical protein
LTETDINPNSTVILFLHGTEEIPSTITISWESTTGERKTQDIDLSVRQQVKEDGGIIALLLTKQGMWTLEKGGF